jgi:hypothetical protein
MFPENIIVSFNSRRLMAQKNSWLVPWPAKRLKDR